MKKQIMLHKNGLLKNPRQLQGFTLIELLVAGTLGLVVILAASGAFLQTYKLNNMTSERVNIQSSVRDAVAKMTADANQAGSFGCANLAMNAANADPTKPLVIGQALFAPGFSNQFFDKVTPDGLNAWGVNLDFSNAVYRDTSAAIDGTSRNVGAYGAAILTAVDVNTKFNMAGNDGILKIYPGTDVLMFQYGDGGSIAYAGENGSNLEFKLNFAENPRLWLSRKSGQQQDGTYVLASCGRIDTGHDSSTSKSTLNFTTGTLSIPKINFSGGNYEIFANAAGADATRGHLANELQFLNLYAPIYFVGEFQVTSATVSSAEPMKSNNPEVYKGLFRADLNGRYPLELLVPNATDLKATFAFAKDCTANTKVIKDRTKHDIVFSKRVRESTAAVDVRNYAPIAVSVDLTVQGAIRGISASGEDEAGGYRTSVYQNIMMAIQGGNICANRIEK